MKENIKSNLACPRCRSARTVWRGFRYNEKAKKRMRFCTSCRTKFTPNDGFLRRRFAKDDIMEAVALSKRGYSLAEVCKKLGREGVHVSRWSVSLWKKKYGNVSR